MLSLIMGLYKYLLISACVVAAIGGVVQRNHPTYSSHKIPVVVGDGRQDCPLIKHLNESLPNCSQLLLHEDDSLWSLINTMLCFGIYDTHYQLCKYNTSIPETELNPPDKKTEGFCDKAKTVFKTYQFEYKNPIVKEWAHRLKASLTDTKNCTNICIYGGDLDNSCSRIVRALEMYPGVLERASSISNEAKLAAPSPIEVSGKHLSLDSKADPQVIASVSNSHLGVDVVPAVSQKGAPSMDSVTHVEASQVPGGAPTVPKQQNSSTKLDDRTKNVVQPEPPHPSSVESKKPEAVVPKNPEAVVPKNPKADEPKMEKTQEEPVEDLALGVNNYNDEIDQQSPDPEDDHEKHGEDVPIGSEDTAKLPDVDKDNIEDPSKEGVQRPLMIGRLDDEEESNLVTYFILMTGGALLFYIAFHNKNKLLALALEGRRANRRGGRHSSAVYSKLHSNLEEAIAAGPTSPSATHVLY